MGKSSKPVGKARPDLERVRVYRLEVLLVNGPVSREFARQNPVVSRTLQMRGDQTLEELHRAIFQALGRGQEQMYEFQIGKGSAAAEVRRYVLPGAEAMAVDGARPPAGLVTEVTLDDLGLEVGQSFLYWFDFAADWWHQIQLQAVEERPPRGTYPKVTRRIGADPPQGSDEDQADEANPHSITGDAAADVSCLIGELHLSKQDYTKAIEAFTRAIESRPTPDAYRGRANAYRGLADADERRAEECV